MSNEATPEPENPAPEDHTEARGAELPDGRLTIEDRSVRPAFNSLTDAFNQKGFPAQSATLEWGEARSLTWGGTADTLAPVRLQGVALGADQRYAWPAFTSVPRGAADTAVSVLAGGE